jgi:pyruvate dehydrogenase E1 component
VTSFTELRRDGRASKKAWVAQCLEGGAGPVIAASDYVSALADLIREWVPGKYVTLGTDGFGRSDTRAALRAHFGVDRAGIVKAALGALG